MQLIHNMQISVSDMMIIRKKQPDFTGSKLLLFTYENKNFSKPAKE